MIRKEKAERGQMEFVCLENMVPEDHLLRKIEAAVDFDKIYEIVEDLYCADNGTWARMDFSDHMSMFTINIMTV